VDVEAVELSPDVVRAAEEVLTAIAAATFVGDGGALSEQARAFIARPIVASAIMAERERCALVVETDVHLDEYLPSAASRLAELIRRGA
jgi:hypothetical protein